MYVYNAPQAQVDKILKLWRKESVYSAEALAELEQGVLPTRVQIRSKSPSGSLTEASAQVRPLQRRRPVGFGGRWEGAYCLPCVDLLPCTSGGLRAPALQDLENGSWQPCMPPSATPLAGGSCLGFERR